MNKGAQEWNERHKKIIEAATVLKNYCHEAGKCYNCIFYPHGQCELNWRPPEAWRLIMIEQAYDIT